MVASARGVGGLTTSEAIQIMKMGLRKRRNAYACVERANVIVSRGQLQKKVDLRQPVTSQPEHGVNSFKAENSEGRTATERTYGSPSRVVLENRQVFLPADFPVANHIDHTGPCHAPTDARAIEDG